MLTPRDGRQEPKGIAGAWRYACPCDRSRMSLDTAPELLTFVLHPIAAFHFTCCLTISSGDHGSPLLSGTKSPTSVRLQRATNRLDQVLTRHSLDDVIVLNERHLRRILASYFDYYHRSRTHPSLDKDAPDERPVQQPGAGKPVAFPPVGGLHHRYERLAA